MPVSFSHGFWQRVHGWLGSQPHHGCDDAQLLERFVASREEAAFQTLLERHGPMVWSVCHRILRHSQDAEDAFQATFMVLLRQAHTINKHGSVSSWLYGVALRTAQKARAMASRRHARENSSMIDTPAPAPKAAMEFNPALEEELARLPDKYRLPLVLCYYQGQTLEGAAQSLGCPLGTLASRMSRGRERLRVRLEKRGVALTATAVAATLAERTSSALPPVLPQRTLQTCLAWLSQGKLVPVSVLSLSQGVMQAMFWSKVKLVSLGIVTLGVLAMSGVGLWSHAGAGNALRQEGERNPAVTGTEETRSRESRRQPGNRSAKWKELAKQRLEVIKQETQLREREFTEGGKTTLEIILANSERFLRAELDLSDKQEQRIAAFRNHVHRLELYYAKSEALYKAGRNPRQDVLHVEYTLIEAKMRLLEEQGE